MASLKYSAKLLQLLDPRAQLHTQPSFKQDNINVRPSNIDNLTRAIYEDLETIASSTGITQSFISLTDTPGAYTSADNRLVGVNAAADGMEYKGWEMTATEFYPFTSGGTIGAGGKGIGKILFDTTGNLDYVGDLELLSDGSQIAVFKANTGFLGLGVVTPLESLHTAGGLKIGTSSQASEGTIRYLGNDFQGYDGTSWKSFGNTSSDYFNKTTDDSDDITEGSTNLFMTVSEKTKLGWITVTQAVDLDQMEIDVALNNAKVGNITTNLSTTQTATTVDVASSDGTDATLPQAIASGNAGVMSGADKAKLDGIEANATADQTDSEIKTAYENNANTNEFSDAEKNKLSSLDGSRFLGEYATLGALQSAHPSPQAGSYANVDAGIGSDVERYIWDSDDTAYIKQLGVSTLLTDAQIKTQYENNANTNAYTDTEKTKVGHISVTQAVDLDAIESDTATNNAKVSNVSTNLSSSTTSTEVTVASSDGLDVILTSADSSDAGILTSAKFDEIAVNNGKVSFPEAPNDGSQYVRRNLAWEAFSSGGKVGITDSSGVYTYYSTFDAAMTAASSGDNIEIFTNLTVTSATELKSGVNINGNGYTITNGEDDATNIFEVKDGGTLVYSSTIQNLRLIRTGRVNGSSGMCFEKNTGSTGGNIDCSNFVCENTYGKAVYLGSSSSGETSGITARGYTTAIENVTHNLINCFGYGETTYGIFSGLADYVKGCTGISVTGSGLLARNASGCFGYSVSGAGLGGGIATTNYHNCYGKSNSSYGAQSVSSEFFHCYAESNSNFGGVGCGGKLSTFKSTSNAAIRMGGGEWLENCVVLSISGRGVQIDNGVTISNCTITTKWNNSLGRAIAGYAGSLTENNAMITNNHIVIANAGAYPIFVASAYISNNSTNGIATAIKHPSTTQLITVNSIDTEGNIIML